ncbi:valine--tRNA ligase [Buchnera aphidicola]|uniref:valine--tRNA ligase n=1 Tax=Buchnera aphidicola TaxID=9 RepID=UPI00094C5A3C|nr:valine--tRNA ligase [Buchnera aphidicola]
MKKIYNPNRIEKYIKKWWNKKNIVKKKINISKKSFCIMMPPPNITGSLHMGHAFQQAIMDSLIRYNHMLGKNVLFQMGTDHAGIATQIVVENYLREKKGKKKGTYSRKEFIKETLNWKKKFESNILYQVQRLGNFINFHDSKFTLDKNFSKAVKKVFIMLYKDGYIYKRKKLVYWDPYLKTVISDLEVEHRILPNTMWYIKYPLIFKKNTKKQKNMYLIVSTTRPETFLGDTALAVHPDDVRYKKYIGQYVSVPLIGRVIPIIADNQIDSNKGTGCMKVTPAHDFHDYHIAITHKLPMINIFTSEGKILSQLEYFDYKGEKINEEKIDIPNILRNIDRFKARKKTIFLLDSISFIEKNESCQSSIPHGDRSGMVLEPMLTNQWYLRVQSLAKTAIRVIKEKKILFISKQYRNMYFSWMNNIEDWCISRQIWWGHQIPIWYDHSNNNMYTGYNEKSIRKEYKIPDHILLEQDSDVLDTWFSSSLWTFAGLGWPTETKKLKYFHPTNVLVSGFDIIFFWIARMIMITTYVMKKVYGIEQVPFKAIYITGLIKDEDGKKMSKSKGNTLDPLDLIDGITLSQLIDKRNKNLVKPKLSSQIVFHTTKQFPNGIEAYGTDALRLTFLSLTSTSRSINWDMNRIKGYKYFCNKIWNVSRFIFLNISKKVEENNLQNSFLDQWILLKYNILLKQYHIFFKIYRFDKLISILYHFVWHDFCDFYLETIKPILRTGLRKEKESVQYILSFIFCSIIHLLHPIMPFITDMLWKNFNELYNIPVQPIVLNSFPMYENNAFPLYLLQFVTWIQKLISVLRVIRVDIGVQYNFTLPLYVKCFSMFKKIFIEENYHFLKKILYLKKILIIIKYHQKSSSLFRIIDDTELFIPISSTVNIKIELLRLQKKILETRVLIKGIMEKVKNKNFLKNAPENIVFEQKRRLQKNSIIYNILKKQKKFLLYQKK